MSITYSETDGNKKNVVYFITLYVGGHGKEYHYIGQTSRRLGDRMYEHTVDRKSAVYRFIDSHDVRDMHAEILYESTIDEIPLDLIETREIYKYVSKRGFDSKRNRLINKNWKGARKHTLKDLGKLSKIDIDIP